MAELSLTGKRWQVGQDARDILSTVPAGRLRSSMLTQILLQSRGIAPFGQQPNLATAGFAAMYFADLPRAVDRIRHAVGAGERVAIFGDYDCDGITSAALLARAFHRRGIRPVLRLPHRVLEGYGLKNAIIQECIVAGVTLLLTVDTGVTAVSEIAMARAAGIDVLILDHHHMQPELPDAYAILHPGLHATFPSPPPSAAGVVWTFVRAWEAADGHTNWEESDTDLALAAIGTIADLVELRGGNRTLAHAGIAALQRIQQGPLALLKLQAGVQDAPVTSRDIGFRIAPRLNAAGRMAEPHIALNGILGDEQSIVHLEELNRERQERVAALFGDALRAAQERQDICICVQSEAYTPGICGLIAGKLTEQLGRPSLVAHLQGDRCVASLRSIPAYNVAEGLERCRNLLLSFGGHAMAAGCTFAASSFEQLRAHLQADVAAQVPPECLLPVLSADLCVQPADLTLDLCEALRILEPFGQGNLEPSFLLQGVTLERSRAVGKEEAHLQALVAGKKCIGFHLGRFSTLPPGPLDMLCRIGIDTWQGSRTVQLFIDDLRMARIGSKCEVVDMRK